MSAAFQIFQLPKAIPLNAGTIMPGGKASFFLTGTSTPTDVFTDPDLLVPHTQPVIADAAGILPTIYLDPTITYKVTLKTSADVLYYTVDPVNDNLLTQSNIGQIIYPRSATEIANGVTPTAYIYEYGHAWRYGCNPDGVTNTTTAVNNWLSCGYKQLYAPAGTYLVGSTCTIRLRSFIEGDGQRMTVFRHTNTATGPLFKVETGAPPSGYVNDVTEGAISLKRLGVQPRDFAGCYGFESTSALCNTFLTENVRIQNQHSETLGSVPYSVTADTRGMNIDGGTGALFAHHINLEIRSCSEALYLRNVTNEWTVHGSFIDNKCGFDLNGISGLRSFVSHESSVTDACDWRLSGNVGSIKSHGERWELPQTTCYAVEIDITGSYANIEFNYPLVLIAGDGTTFPGRKYLASDGVRGGANGTLPNGIIFRVMMGNSLLTMGSASTEHQFGPILRAGGANIGNGKITVGRDAGSADSTWYYDTGTGHTYFIAGNNLRMSGDASTSFKFSVNSTGICAYGGNPIAQPTTGGAAATFVAGAGTGVNDASTFDGYTLKQVVKALRNLGFLA